MAKVRLKITPLLFSLLVPIFLWGLDPHQEKRKENFLRETRKEVILSQAEDLLHFFSKKEDWEACAQILLKKVSVLEKGKPVLDFLQAEPALSIRQCLPHNEYKAKLLGYLAINCRREGNFVQAMKYYDACLAIFYKNKNTGTLVAWAYKNAAQCAMRLLDYEKTYVYALRSLEADTSGTYLWINYASLSSASYYLKHYEEALAYFRKGLLLGGREAHRISLNYTGAKIFAQLHKEKEARDLLQTNKKIILSKQSYLPSSYYLAEADVLTSLDKYSLALPILQKAIEVFHNDFPNIKSREAAKIYCQLGDVYLYLAQYDKALEQYQKALFQLFADFDDSNLHSNPPIESIYPESWIMTVLANKGKTLLLKYQKENTDKKLLLDAKECFHLSLVASSALRTLYNGDDGKLYLQEYNTGTIEKAILSSYLLYENTKDVVHLQEAYDYAEYHKALVLREAIAKNNAPFKTKVPSSLLSKEKELRAQVLRLKMQVNKEKSKSIATDRQHLSRLQNKLTNAQNQYWVLIDDIKKNYPSFTFGLKQANPFGEKKIQKKLPDAHSALLHFYWGEENIFAFFIRKKDFHCSRIPLSDALLNKIKHFSQMLSDRKQLEQSPELFFSLASDLGNLFYNSLLSPNTVINKVFLIPDGLLSALPFEALLSRPYSGPYAYAPYLLHTVDWQYAFAPSLLFPENETPNTQARGVLGVAPVFENNQRGLATLSESIAEVNAIPSASRKLLQGKEASKENFKKWVQHFQIIHCSTHASAGGDGLPPRIELADSSLFLPELYTMSIPAELLVLSACETKRGHYQQGEGVMSLSRGFAYAGTRSMIASLWKVNEKSTHILFDYFYSRLNGQSKATALSFARREYLSDTSISARYKSPYYWASFIFTGSDGYIHLHQPKVGTHLLYFVAISICCIGMLFLALFKKVVVASPTPPSSR